ncbi:MAG: type II toxin-antitoxin system Phd/YefM family antitoxin [Clostridiales bacterium]|jgi:PHD/YefM family antitoxin component YafN of YafNO toxin-antitoxin module|nr:type II toxin-antitoxin system Phd/YefM family antitoxin [Clostridiales bacterium]
MAHIIPIRDLRKCAEISELAHKSGEPIFVTRNGYGDMVIMSMESYEKNFAENAVYNAIAESVEQVKNGAKPIPIDEVFERLEAKYAGH